MKNTILPKTHLILLCAVGALSGRAVADEVADDFESTMLDVARWESYDIYPGSATAVVDSGQIAISLNSTAPVANLGIKTRRTFVGDFCVEVDYDYAFDGGTGWTGLQLRIVGEAGRYAAMFRSTNTSCCSHYHVTSSTPEQGQLSHKVTTPSSNAGRMRVTRAGMVWDFYLDQGGGFVHEATWATGFTDDVRIALGAASDALGTQDAPLFTIKFDNFLAQGTILFEPEFALIDLAQQVIDLNLNNGIENSLDAKLDHVLIAWETTIGMDFNAALGALGAFINAVEAQRGNHIPEEDADALIAHAELIIMQLL